MAPVARQDARCDAKESECVCNRVGRHRIHRCSCGGSWEYVDGQMRPRTYPGGYRDPWSAIDAYFSLGTWR